MDFASKLKMPKLDVAAAAAQLKNMQKLSGNLQKVGSELGDIVGALGSIGTQVAETVTSGSVDNSAATKLRENVEEVNRSQKTVVENIEEIKGIVEEFQKFIGAGDKADNKEGKIPKIINATLELVELVTQILEQLVLLVDKVDALMDPEKADSIIETAKEIGVDIIEIGKMVIEVKDKVKEIVDIAKGNDGDKDKSEKKEKAIKSEKQVKKSKGDENGNNGPKVVDDNGDDNEKQGCWAKCVSCFCCCC